MSDEQAYTYDYDGIVPGYYDEVFRRGSGIQSKWHHLKFRHVYASFPDDVRDHLDVGCGPGTFIGTLPNEMRCVGTDLAKAQIDYANREYGTTSHSFVCVRDDTLPFEVAQFDVVTSIELIEHLQPIAIDRLLKEVRRVLRPGGRLLLTTPNYAGFWPLLEKVVNARAPVSYENQHVTFFTPEKLRELLIDQGFADVHVSTFQGAAPFAAAVSWKLADRVQILENPVLARAMGFLLLGSARNP